MRTLSRWRGNRRLRHGYCPLCNSSPPDPTCRVCRGSRDYGPNQTHDTAENWWVAWHRIIGFPEPLTKGLVAGRGVAPKNPPPLTWPVDDEMWALLTGEAVTDDDDNGLPPTQHST